jgi:hypothetical protein
VVYFIFLSFKFKVVGGWPDSQSLVIRFAHPTGRPSGAQQTTLCLQQQKVTKKCRNLTKIDPDITYLPWDSFIRYTLAIPT